MAHAHSLRDAKQATLSEKEIMIVEYAIRKRVSLYNERREVRIIDLKKYKRQYFPGITLSGEREAWVRCIDEEVIKNFSGLMPDWRKNYIKIWDGGDNIFSLQVTLSTLKTYNFVTNGSDIL